MKNKTILITGGAGFIGSHVVEDLIDSEYNLVVIDNFNDYYSPDFKRQNIKLFLDKISLYEGDITNKEKITEIFEEENIDKVIHLAARAGVRASIESPNLYYKTNVEGTLNLLELSKNFDIENFIFASSSSVYGNRTETPFKESDQTKKPTSPYAATKQACERLIYSYHHLYNINASVLRFFTVYGERGRPDMAPFIFTNLILNEKPIKRFGDGSSKRDYTYVKDITKGIIKCLEQTHEYEIFNLGSNNPVELNDFIKTLEKVSGKKAKINQFPEQSGDVEITHADNIKAKEILNWKPKISLEKGLEKFVSWFKENRL